ncbi:hypothetical protein A152_0016350 [Vibrio tasmaniensis 1F-187]|uniref:Uncharacterized protein n=1 Tax=Vibrio splendidus 12E03 TaxID=1191305 RepID=A0A1E5FX41_VIBSP|nr:MULTISPECIES: hypothetical protein [Vibrio]OEF69417.1 hypothetical protein A152_18975 [Vibrio tasmaniensis 1F-187]OEF95077.1 hypothetical protein A142_15240 [Vibrio splendidus 12E03]
MKLSRNSLKMSEKKVKDAEAFIEASEPNASSCEGRGRPRQSSELTKPVSISLTNTDKRTLDDQFKRFNSLSYKMQLDDEKTLNRSDIIRIVANKLAEMDDEELIKFLR